MTQPPEKNEKDGFNEPIQSDGDDLRSYIRHIKKYPILSHEDEMTLAREWIAHHNTKSAHILVTSHLKLVVKVAFGYRGYGLPLNDLIAEGNIGLLQAVKKFDPERGFRFSTYAIWWIKAAMQEYILQSWSLVRIGQSVAQKKLFFNLKRIKAKLDNMGGLTKSLSDLDIRKIAKDLDVKEDDVKYMEGRLSFGDTSLNAPLSQNEEGGQWQDFLESEDASQEDQFLDTERVQRKKELLHECLNAMTPREAEILKLRRLSEPHQSLEAISKKLNISGERVRQIEVKSFRKLCLLMRNALRKRGWTFDEL